MEFKYSIRQLSTAHPPNGMVCARWMFEVLSILYPTWLIFILFMTRTRRPLRDDTEHSKDERKLALLTRRGAQHGMPKLKTCDGYAPTTTPTQQ